MPRGVLQPSPSFVQTGIHTLEDVRSRYDCRVCTHEMVIPAVPIVVLLIFCTFGFAPANSTESTLATCDDHHNLRPRDHRCVKRHLSVPVIMRGHN